MFGPILLAGIFAVSSVFGVGNAPSETSFEAFKTYHNKIYASSADEARSKAAFQTNAALVAANNAQENPAFTMELNKLSDLDQAAYQKMNGYIKSNMSSSSSVLPANTTIAKRQAAPPASFDWRDHNGVSPVKDQGYTCGCCWAFSTTGAMESQMLISSQSFVSLSEEQLIDCDTSDGGCNGGNFATAWTYIQSAGGLDTEQSYPYTAINGASSPCQYNAANSAATIVGQTEVPSNDAAIVQALTTYGPLSISVDANQTGFQMYSNGIYTCTAPPNLNHAVLVVGYTSDYWIVKNSWGTDWGINGYFYLARGQGDCGMTQDVAYPQLGSSSSPASTTGSSTPVSSTTGSSSSTGTNGSSSSTGTNGSSSSTGTTGSSSSTTGTTGSGSVSG